jgi:hypothetical protein
MKTIGWAAIVYVHDAYAHVQFAVLFGSALDRGVRGWAG